MNKICGRKTKEKTRKDKNERKEKIEITLHELCPHQGKTMWPIPESFKLFMQYQIYNTYKYLYNNIYISNNNIYIYIIITQYRI